MCTIVVSKLGHHRLDRATRKAPSPVRARQFIRDCSLTVRLNGRLHVADQLRSRKTDNPVQPLLGAIGRRPRFEPSETFAKPFERRRRPIFILVDRWIAEYHEHFLGMRHSLW